MKFIFFVLVGATCLGLIGTGWVRFGIAVVNVFLNTFVQCLEVARHAT